jgi:hypothetical protein
LRYNVPKNYRKPIGYILLVLSAGWHLIFFIDSSGNSRVREKYVIPGNEIMSYECYAYGKRDRSIGLKLALPSQTISLNLPNWVDCEAANSTLIKSLTANGVFVLRWESEKTDFIELEKGIWAVNKVNNALVIFGLIFTAVFILEDKARALAKYWEKHKV